jgi:hypothetical protein
VQVEQHPLPLATYVAGASLFAALVVTAALATTLAPMPLTLAMASVLGCSAAFVGALRRSSLHRRAGEVLPEGVVIEDLAPRDHTYRTHAEPQPDEVRMLVRRTPRIFALTIVMHLGLGWLPLVSLSACSTNPWAAAPYVALAWLVLAAVCLDGERRLRIERRTRTLHFDDSSVGLPQGATLSLRARQKHGTVLERLDADGEPVRLREHHATLEHPKTLECLLREVFPDLVFVPPTTRSRVADSARDLTQRAAKEARQRWEVVAIELRKRDDGEPPIGL